MYGIRKSKKKRNTAVLQYYIPYFEAHDKNSKTKHSRVKKERSVGLKQTKKKNSLCACNTRKNTLLPRPQHSTWYSLRERFFGTPDIPGKERGLFTVALLLFAAFLFLSPSRP